MYASDFTELAEGFAGPATPCMGAFTQQVAQVYSRMAPSPTLIPEGAMPRSGRSVARRASRENGEVVI